MYIKGKDVLTDAVIEGLQDKKASRIVVADLTGIEDTVCRKFVIAQAGSTTQIHALAISVGDKVRQLCQTRPLAVEGMRQAVWVAMDYADVIVHIFLPEERAFYDLEHLWADAELTELPDID